MQGIGKSDVGTVRANNEDAIYINNEGLGGIPNLFVVADGMGGHNAGEVASRKAIAAFCDFLKSNSDFEYIQDLLAQGLVHANLLVHEEASSNPAYTGMGTTFSACTVANNNLYYAHVGDSRIYIIRQDGISQLTRDHSLVADMVEEGAVTHEEARSHPNKNIITRAVGTDNHVNVDKGYFSLDGVKYVLLCSDGLTDMLNDIEIFEILQAKGNLNEKIDSLVNRALQAGGDDNISVIVMGWGVDK